MATKVKKGRNARFSKSSFRRLFSRKKKNKSTEVVRNKSTEEVNNAASLPSFETKLPSFETKLPSFETKLAKVKTLAWTPDDVFDQIHGTPVLDEISGEILLLEVGDIDRGWVLDFSSEKAVITRYDIPGFGNRNSKKAPNGPPSSSLEVGGVEGKSVNMKSLPWVWYRDSKIYSKIESGKMSDMAAYVTGKIAASGDTSAWDKLDTTWKEAKKRVTEQKKVLCLEQGTDDGAGDKGEEDNGNENEDEDEGEGEGEDEDEEDENEEDEEANIIATFKPEIEPLDPRTKAFWMRHFGTDALVSAYLYLWSSVAYTLVTINSFKTSLTTADSIQQAHSLANVAAAIMYAVGSAYFIKMSYPETTMLMFYRVMTRDPNDMTFVQRYFTANEMLIALWLFSAAWFAPLSIVALYELFILSKYHQASLDMLTLIAAVPFMVIFNAPAMPDLMRANNGRGTSYLFDKVCVPLLCLNRDESRLEFYRTHLGSDGLATVWVFAVLGVVGGVAVIPLVIMHFRSHEAWILFWTTIPFTLGSLLMVRSSYPETMNTSFFFSTDSSTEATGTIKSSESIGEDTPLLLS